MNTVAVLAFAIGLFAQSQNAWDGSWRWGTYEERIAYAQRGIDEAAAIAHEHCGEPYFGTLCP